MRNRSALLILLLSAALGVVFPARAADPKRKLVLVGGGDRPSAAMKRYAEWAGGAQAKVLIIGWSSEQPEVYFASISKDLRAQGVVDFTASLAGPKTDAEVAAFTEEFLAKLDSATAVFFAGGDQRQHMKVIDLPGIRAALEAKHAAGIPFAGTSAGTAIMSEAMLTGKGSETARGLGFLKGVVVDQHFILRQRFERLKAAMGAAGVSRGLGIDEDAAVSVIDGDEIEVIGGNRTRITDGKFAIFYRVGEGDAILEERLAVMDRARIRTGEVVRHCPELLLNAGG